MKRLKFLLALIAMFGMAANLSAQSDQQTDLPSAESILKKYVEVTGGVANYKSIKTLVAAADVGIPQMGIEGTMKMQLKMPNMASVVASLPGVGDQVQGSNGKYSWSSNAMMGTRLISGQEEEQMKEQLEIERYVDPAGFYKSIKTLGVEDVAGEKAYKVEVEKKTGTKQTEFYSVKTGLLVKQVITVNAAGMGEITIASMISDYKDSGKFKVPFKITQMLPNNMEQVIEFTKFEYNGKVDDSAFAPPADVQKLIDKKENAKID